MTGKRGRKHKQLLDGLKEQTGYYILKEEVAECAVHSLDTVVSNEYILPSITEWKALRLHFVEKLLRKRLRTCRKTV